MGRKAFNNLKNWVAAIALAAPVAVAPGHAGDFTFNLGTNPNWPSGGIGPINFTITDEFGYEIDVQAQITRFGGTPLGGWPNETNIFGTATSVGVVWDSGSGTSGIGEATNTATLTFTSGGSPFATDGVTFTISDIDSVDNNSTTDRCDFVTVTGDVGTPTLALSIPATAATSVVVGPGPGSGATGALLSNQAQCIYNTGPTGSPNSTADDNGSVVATWPAGTSIASVLYDESIENVLGNNNLNAAARGIGVWSAAVVTADQSISLVKSADVSTFSAAGETITYTYLITNNGSLPINTSQDIEIDDDVLGNFVCGTITSDIPVGGTHSCTATYNTTAGDVTAGSVVNVATAGVGTPGQSFGTRLQSATDTVTVDLAAPSFSISKSVDQSNISSTVTLNYTIDVQNTGNVDLTNPVITDQLLQGGASRTLTSGPTLVAATDTDSDGELDVGETWQYTATYSVPQSNINNGNDLVNTATFDTDETTSQSDSATTTITQDPELTLTKVADLANINAAGDLITYTITLENTGNISISSITVTDPLLTGISCSPGSGNTPNNRAPGTSATCTGTYTVLQSDLDNNGGGDGDLDNTVTVDADYSGPLPPFTQTADATVPIVLNPALNVTKLADQTSNVAQGTTVTYTYVVTNSGNQTISGISLSDVHTGNGPAPVPANETLTADNGTAGDSSDGGSDGVWDVLAPNDEVTFTATYTVTQSDIDTLQ